MVYTASDKYYFAIKGWNVSICVERDNVSRDDAVKHIGGFLLILQVLKIV